jgi:hypothetical protein
MPLQLQGNWSGLQSTVCSHKSMAVTKNGPANPRVVSPDIRPRQLGYVIFEYPLLVDWGVIRFPRGSGHVDRSVKLLRTFQPCVVVLREIATGSRRDRPVVRDVIRAIQHEASRLSLSSVFIDEVAVRRLFSNYPKPTKQEIASVVAACFPELASRLPPPRRPWDPEHHSMPIFDAAAMGLTAIAREFDSDSVRELLKSGESFRRPLGGAAN